MNEHLAAAGKSPRREYKSPKAKLKELGNDSYAEYLQSPLWRSIREKVHRRAGHRCRACGKRSQCVHHRSYREEVLRGEQLGALVALCADCHHHIEFEDGKKVGLARANARLGMLMCKSPVARAIRKRKAAAKKQKRCERFQERVVARGGNSRARRRARRKKLRTRKAL